MHLYCTYNIVNDPILHIRFYASTQINILTFAHINQLPMHTFKKLMNQNIIFICLFISPNLIFLGHFYINKILCTYNFMLNLKLHLHIRLRLVCNIILKLQDFCLFIWLLMTLSPVGWWNEHSVLLWSLFMEMQAKQCFYMSSWGLLLLSWKVSSRQGEVVQNAFQPSLHAGLAC